MKILKHWTEKTTWLTLIGRPEILEEKWDVENEKGYSARWGIVTKSKGEYFCSCIQAKRYNKCTHLDFILGRQYTNN